MCYACKQQPPSSAKNVQQKGCKCSTTEAVRAGGHAQAVCKACALLEGLNRGRPQQAVGRARQRGARAGAAPSALSRAARGARAPSAAASGGAGAGDEAPPAALRAALNACAAAATPDVCAHPDVCVNPGFGCAGACAGAPAAQTRAPGVAAEAACLTSDSARDEEGSCNGAAPSAATTCGTVRGDGAAPGAGPGSACADPPLASSCVPRGACALMPGLDGGGEDCARPGAACAAT